MKVQPLLPQPISTRKKVLRRSIDGDAVFIRFVCGEIDRDSHVAAGIFCAAYALLESHGLPWYELDELVELREWFNTHLKSPFDYLAYHKRYDRAVCWFKPTAHEHLARAWELAAILERNDIVIWTIKSPRAGYVHYEDDIQVFAQPHPDVRLLLERR
ncbi:MAG TPA: hypothetical protein VFR78_15660 [Pyrinomonadaceae bacterium]|nr:hypothetical protein [Pyrinomonadaceae bacterium]